MFSFILKSLQWVHINEAKWLCSLSEWENVFDYELLLWQNAFVWRFVGEIKIMDMKMVMVGVFKGTAESWSALMLNTPKYN